MMKMIKWPLHPTGDASTTDAVVVRVPQASVVCTVGGDTGKDRGLAAQAAEAVHKIFIVNAVIRAIQKEDTDRAQTLLSVVTVSRMTTGSVDAVETMVAKAVATAATTNLAGPAEKEIEMVS